MVNLYEPKKKDLWFRKQFMSDEETMSYNLAWGGTIPFPEEKWNDWYEYWIDKNESKRFYRYIYDEETKTFVGEVAYHYDTDYKVYIADVIVCAKNRGKGYGEQGLQLLCECAKLNGITELYDNIAIDNASIKLFLKAGFTEEYHNDKVIMLKKKLF